MARKAKRLVINDQVARYLLPSPLLRQAAIGIQVCMHEDPDSQTCSVAVLGLLRQIKPLLSTEEARIEWRTTYRRKQAARNASASLRVPLPSAVYKTALLS